MTKPIQYHRLQKFIHWLMAALVIAMLFIGVTMSHSVAEHRLWLMALHQPLGILIFVLVPIRLYFRWRFGVPALPAQIPTTQQWIARASHWLFYLLLFVLPLSGITLLWFGGYPGMVSSHADLPYPHLYSVLRSGHGYFAYGLLGLLLLHLTAACMHGLIFRDHVLASMTLSPRATLGTDTRAKKSHTETAQEHSVVN